MSDWPWRTTSTPDGTWTTTCKGCGVTRSSPFCSQLVALRSGHECSEGGTA